MQLLITQFKFFQIETFSRFVTTMKIPKGKKSQFFQGGPKNVIILTIVLFGGILLLHRLSDYARQIKSVSYSAYVKRVEQDDVKQVYVSDQEVRGLFRDGSRFETVTPNNPQYWELLKKQ